MPQEKAPSASKEKLSFLENFGFGLGDMASNFFFQTFSVFLLYYYTDVFGISPAAAGTMFVITRAIDAFTDPAMGLLADRTRTRWGKYRPYLLWMAIPYGICGYLIFANPDLEGASRLVYAYITYSLMMLAYTAINVPYSSLMGVLSPSSFARTIASNFRFVGAFGGGLAISMFVRPLVEKLGRGDEVLGFQYTMAIFAIVSIALFWVTFITTKERVRPPEGQKNDIAGEVGELFKNMPWIALFFAAVFSVTFIVARDSVTIHYFKYVVKVGDEKVFWILDKTSLFLSLGKLSMMIGVFCVGFFVRHIDKKPLAIGLTLITAICLFSFYFIPKDQFALMLVVNSISSFMMGPTSALVWSMYGDVADFGEYKFNRRSTGLIHSASLFSLKMGSMIAGALGGYVLAYFGFEKDQEQSERAVFGIVLMFTFIPAFFAFLKAVALWVYPLNAEMISEVEKSLEQRKVADHT